MSTRTLHLPHVRPPRPGSTDLLRRLLPSGAHTSESFSPEIQELFPEELEFVADALPRRRAQFSTVRSCARTALGELGFPPGPILRGPGGAPVWPAGVVGSMTHCRTYCAAAVAPAAELLTLGIDAEPAGPLPPGVVNLVASGQEQSALRRLSGTNPLTAWDRLLFCVKEAVYKAWYPLTGQWLTFLDATAELDPGGTFSVRMHPKSGVNPDLALWQGTWLQSSDLLLAACWVSVMTRQPAPQREVPRSEMTLSA